MYTGMERLEALKYTYDLRVADFPHVVKNERSKTHEYFHKAAYPTHQDPVISMDEMAKEMGMTNGR